MASRVLLIEKRALVRAAVRSLLEQMPVVRDVAARATLDGTSPGEGSADAPDAVVLSGDGLPLRELEKLVGKVLDGTPDGVRVVVLDTRPDEHRAARAFAAGAGAYLSVRCDPADLERAIADEGPGSRVLGSCLSPKIVESIENGAAPRVDPIETLTARQRQILRMVARGQRSADIARELQISSKTVEAHRSELLRRLGVQNVAGLVQLAVRAGIADGD